MSSAPNEVIPGPTGRRVVENITRLRKHRGLTREQLSERLSAAGRPIRATGLARLENGRRRVDADDLVAIAIALDVSPARLLLSGADERDETSPETLLMPGGYEVALTEQRSVPWDQAWRWATGVAPLDDRGPEDLVRWLRLNRPHDDEAIVAAWIAAIEQTPGWAVERDECGRVTHITGPNAREGGPPVRTSPPASLPPLRLPASSGGSE